MRGRKEARWAVVISVTLITAGLILSCGDDEDEGPAVSCRDACENLEKCELLPDKYLGVTVADCTGICEGELEGEGEGGDLTELYDCITDTDCDYLKADCLCQAYCEKLDGCSFLSLLWYDDVDECVTDCAGGYSIYTIMCTLGYSSCYFIEHFCLPK
jgi:hypothetical protein